MLKKCILLKPNSSRQQIAFPSETSFDESGIFLIPLSVVIRWLCERQICLQCPRKHSCLLLSDAVLWRYDRMANCLLLRLPTHLLFCKIFCFSNSHRYIFILQYYDIVSWNQNIEYLFKKTTRLVECFCWNRQVLVVF
jgi:hypothetical protein